MMRLVLILVGLLILSSCSNVHETPQIRQQEEWTKWHQLSISFEKGDINDLFILIRGNDTLGYSNSKRDSSNKKVETRQNLILNKAEQDSLFKYCYLMIIHPQHNEGYLTDYAGEFIYISLKEGVTEIKCEYSSLGDNYNDIPFMSKLEGLTFSKLKKN